MPPVFTCLAPAVLATTSAATSTTSAAAIVERIRPFLSAEGARLTFAFAVEWCRTLKRADRRVVDAERARHRSKIEKRLRVLRPRNVQHVLLPVERVVIERDVSAGRLRPAGSAANSNSSTPSPASDRAQLPLQEVHPCRGDLPSSENDVLVSDDAADLRAAARSTRNADCNASAGPRAGTRGSARRPRCLQLCSALIRTSGVSLRKSGRRWSPGDA